MTNELGKRKKRTNSAAAEFFKLFFINIFYELFCKILDNFTFLRRKHLFELI